MNVYSIKRAYVRRPVIVVVVVVCTVATIGGALYDLGHGFAMVVADVTETAWDMVREMAADVRKAW